MDGPCGVLLLICGPPACGKTYLVKEILASAASKADFPCAFVSLSFDRLYPQDARRFSDDDSRVSTCITLVVTDRTEDCPLRR